MAFENINVVRLKNSISSCKNSINHSLEEQILNNISNSNEWNTSSAENLKKSIRNLLNIHYDKLKRTLNTYEVVARYIEQYQKLDRENNNYNNKKNELNNRIVYNRQIMNETNKTALQYKERTMKNQLKSLNNQIFSNKQRMTELKAQISNLI